MYECVQSTWQLAGNGQVRIPDNLRIAARVYHEVGIAGRRLGVGGRTGKPFFPISPSMDIRLVHWMVVAQGDRVVD